MPIDPNVFNNLRTFQDYQRAEEEFQMRKQLAASQMQRAQQGADLPAAIQIANEYAKARASGDTQRMNDIELAAKLFDRGVVTNGGVASPVAGYPEAVAQIGATKAGAEQQAQKSVDAVMNPVIAAGETNARLQQQLGLEPKIEAAKADVKNQADRSLDRMKKASQANDTLSTLDQIESPDESGLSLLDKATGSTVGAVVAQGKKVVGTSDESTQANAALEVLGNRLVMNIPRMEGPQSDKDTQLYRSMAGRIADPQVPAADKRAAIAAIRELNAKYANQPIGPGVPGGEVPLTPMQQAPLSKEDAINELRRRGKL